MKQAKKQTQGKVSGRGQAKTNKQKKSKTGKVVGLTICLVVLVCMVAFGILGAAAAHSDGIYSKVRYGDVELGGLTVEAAAEKLSAAGVASSADQSVTVDLPGGQTLAISAADAGLANGPEEIAQRAYDYGRNGNFISNTAVYIGSLFLSHDIAKDTAFYIDEAYVRGEVDKAVDQFNRNTLQDSYRVEAEQLVVVKGTAGILLDADALYDLIYNAFVAGNYETIFYNPQPTDSADIDIDALYDAVYQEPANAVYDPSTDSITPETVGRSFDKAKALAQIREAQAGEEIVIPLTLTVPEVTEESLKATLFVDLLYSATTDLTTNSNRNTNIELAANAVSGHVMMPGDVFSFNEVVGQRTAEKGYKTAAAYMNGQVVQEIGGGICQVSSTLYYVTLHIPDLDIVYRTNHRYIATYLPLGMDATVSWGGPDFKFQNNMNHPIKIVAYRSGYQVTVEIYGTKQTDNYVKMEYAVTGVIDYDTIEKEDASIAPGDRVVETSGVNGYVVETYKKIYDKDGNLLSSHLEATSTYGKRDEVILVGPVSEAADVPASPDVSPSPEPSPSTGPEETSSPAVSPTPEVSPAPAVSPESMSA